MIDIGLDDVIITDEFDAALQELTILFNTSNTELLGNTKYGMNFEQFLWALTPQVDSLEKYIKEKINTCTFYLRNFRYDINIEYIYEEHQGIYIVKFSLYKNNKTVNHKFIIK